MRYAALAIDYDGTLAMHGRVAPPVLEALGEAAASGRRLVLVTGRELDELIGVFPQIGIFDRVVAENGALLYDPAKRSRRNLGEAPPAAFVRELARRGVAPLAVGETIVATVHPNETVVLETIRDLGLELQVIFNKGAVMVLPASVNKASGLRAALDELGLSPRNVAAIGDAENDHALLRAAEYGVAVANAVPMLQREADRISARENGAAVIELARDLVAHDLQAMPPRAPRRAIVLGTRADGTAVQLAPLGCNLLVAGASASGKSALVSALLERVAAEGYQFCVFDPDGDYAGLAEAIVFGDAGREPGAAEAFTALEKPDARVVLNLSALALEARPRFLRDMLPQLAGLRARTGRPHWLVIGEAHHLMARDVALPAGIAADALGGTIFVTVHPESVHGDALRTVELAVALGATADATLQQFGRGAGLASIASPPGAPQPGQGLLWRRDAAARAELLRIAPTKAQRRRDRRGLTHELAPERSFRFRGPQGKLNLRAQTLALFLQIGEGVDEETWLHHLRAGDYSRWLRASVEDDALADEVAALERDESAAADESRARIRAAIEDRYGAGSGTAA
jgi:hydroxymethylpyrimidine pyrophosphatase-like HAD family hydrolase